MRSFALLLICLLMPALGGWTIISKADLAQLYDKDKLPELNAQEYLEDGIRPYANTHATPALTVLDAIEQDFDQACADYGFRHSDTAFPCNFWMEIKGSVVKVDNASQSGRAWILPEGTAKNPADDEDGTIILMIGPAIDSMGPRDGYPELKYDQFNDQAKFGSFGREINKLLSAYIKEKMSSVQQGSTVDVIGVLSTWDMLYDTPEVVPVLFR